MNLLQCESPDCQTDAALVLIAGCLNQHLSDWLLCRSHFEMTMASFKSTVCGACLLHFELYEGKEIYLISDSKQRNLLNIRPQQKKRREQLNNRPYLGITWLDSSWPSNSNTYKWPDRVYPVKASDYIPPINVTKKSEWFERK